MDDYQKYIHKSRYARWDEKKKRRENWDETVDRLISYYQKQVSKIKPELLTSEDFKVFDQIREAVTNMEVMPSMRCMMTAGQALDRCNVAAYNCAYLPVDSPRSFDEAMYILMCGTGVGFSVEERYTNQLPRISEKFEYTDTTITVADSKEGWSKSFRELVALLIAGQIPRWDTSKVRPEGARLVTFGGRASGPKPLVRLFKFAVALFRNAAGRRLTPIECHDLMCMVADIVVVGGVRRSAMISLSDLDNEIMANAKGYIHIDQYHLLEEEDDGQRRYSIQFDDPGYGLKNQVVELGLYDSEVLERENKIGWWVLHVYRQLANNSAVYNNKPGVSGFLKEWKSLYDSHSGERGIFNREAAQMLAARNGRRNTEFEYGTNPCSEIILRAFQFCNLSEVVVRVGDTLETLKAKVELATILGTIQSTLTDFKYLRKIWQKNTEEERLLGVSLTGIADNAALYYDDGTILEQLREHAVKVNEKWSALLGIQQSVAITCNKPSGTVSELVYSPSGLHAWWADFFIRTVRNDVKDPLSQFLIDAGVPYEQDQRNASALVFSFPKRAAPGAIVRKDVSAVKALEVWKTFQMSWCEHKPSVTISVAEEEWMDVAAWSYNNFDILSGVSYLPFDPTEYPQAPYQTITEEKYNELVAAMPKDIDWSKLDSYEQEDQTTGSQELACTAGGCEI